MLGAPVPVATSSAHMLAPPPPSRGGAAAAAAAAHAAEAAAQERSGPFSGSPYTAGGGGGQAYSAPPPPLAPAAAPAPAPGMTTVYGGDGAYGGGGAYGDTYGGADYEEEHAPPPSCSCAAADTYGSEYGAYPTYDTHGALEPPRPPQQPQPPSQPRPQPHPLAADYSPLLDGEHADEPPRPSDAAPYLHGATHGGDATVSAPPVDEHSVGGGTAADARGDGAVSPSADVPDDWWRHTQPQRPAQPNSLLAQFVSGAPLDDASGGGARSGWKEGL